MVTPWMSIAWPCAGAVTFSPLLEGGGVREWLGQVESRELRELCRGGKGVSKSWGGVKVRRGLEGNRNHISVEDHRKLER
jgi:hypothetical protein